MDFTHIHCSLRYDRPASDVTNAVQGWRTQADLITMTEVGAIDRKRALAEQGWGYFSSGSNATGGLEECGTTWDLSVFTQKYGRSLVIHGQWPTIDNKMRYALRSDTVIVQHRTSGHKILTSTTHMPAQVGGPTGWDPKLFMAQERKRAYIQGAQSWNKQITELIRVHKPDVVLLNADWNINFKAAWFRQFLLTTFKTAGLIPAWKHFGSRGTFNGAFIDGTLYRGADTDGSVVLPHDVVSDHTAFKTAYSVTNKPGAPQGPGVDNGDGTTMKQGTPWWNFEDYGDNTLYHIEVL